MNQGADRIVQRILEDAGSRAEALVAEAKEQAARTIAGVEEIAEDQQRQAFKQAELQVEEHKRRILGAAQLESRKSTLQAKQNIIEDVFKQALRELADMEPEAYFQLLSRMILKAAEKGDETVFLSSRDKQRIPDGFWEEINRQLLNTARRGALILAEETRDIPGGMVLQAGGVEINSSFSALLEIYREELEPAVAAILFEST